MADRIEDRKVQDISIDRIVECIATNLVGWLQQSRNRHAFAGKGERGQEIPLHLCGEVHAPATSGQLVRISVVTSSSDVLRDLETKLDAALPETVIDFAEREAENTEPVSALGDGDPESETVGASCFKQLLGSETAARHGALYRLGQLL